jgi:hypothetical protein
MFMKDPPIILGYDHLWPVQIQPTFRRDMSLHFSGSDCYLLLPDFLLGLLFDTEDGDEMYFLNVDLLLTEHTT